MNNGRPINLWSEDDRPREKLLLKGRHTLSNAELLSILIGSGTALRSAVDLAKEILIQSNNNLNELAKKTINDLRKIPGIGFVKASSIMAAIELGKRSIESEALTRKKITCSKDAYELLQSKIGSLTYESFWMLLLDRANKIISSKQISEGGISGTVADPKKIFKFAIDLQASSIILCHNHPSGNLEPSEADIRLTKKLINGSELLDLQILDHIIIGDQNYFSFADNNRL